MWFKKKSVLQAEHHYDTEKSADGSTDLRTTRKIYSYNSNSITNSGLPSAADANNYFYLPALGFYYNGQLKDLNHRGYYWSSSAYPQDSHFACCLFFYSGYVSASASGRENVFRAEALQ